MNDKPIRIYEEVKGARTIGISGHIRPDGDCVGSCLGLYLFLKKVCPDAHIQVLLEKPADIFDCIRGFDEINSTFEPITDVFDVYIALDTGKERIGGAEPFFDRAAKTINIDHHISNAEGTGDVNYIVTSSSSTAELVFDVLDQEKLDADIAKALYMGIVHDTGVFRYSNTSPKTMRTAALLMSYDFDFSELIDKTFYEKTHLQNRLLGMVLTESRMVMDGQVIVGSVDARQMQENHAEDNDLDGIVSQLVITKGVHCAVFMHPLKDGDWKISLRSDGLVDVAAVAECFGGGGHKRAAGVTMQGGREEILEKLLGQIRKGLGDVSRNH